MEGENFVSLKGKLIQKDLKQVGVKNVYMFKSKMYLPINGRAQYIRVVAWANLAEDLYNLPKDTYVHIHGHIEESSYNQNCKHCNGPDKKYWTEVVIDNFKTINEEN